MAFTNPLYIKMVADVTAATGATDKLTALGNGFAAALLEKLSENYPLPPSAQNAADATVAEFVDNVSTCLTLLGLE